MLKINRNLSVLLSLILTLFVFLGLLFLTVAIPSMSCFVLHIRFAELLTDSYIPILILLYGILVPAYAAVVSLLRLLLHIRKGMVFSPSSVFCLRLISWCCFAECVLFGVMGQYFCLSFVLAFAALFMGLILRVVKNVIEEATAIKDENDLTV